MPDTSFARLYMRDGKRRDNPHKASSSGAAVFSKCLPGKSCGAGAGCRWHHMRHTGAAKDGGSAASSTPLSTCTLRTRAKSSLAYLPLERIAPKLLDSPFNLFRLHDLLHVLVPHIRKLRAFCFLIVGYSAFCLPFDLFGHLIRTGEE